MGSHRVMGVIFGGDLFWGANWGVPLKKKFLKFLVNRYRKKREVSSTSEHLFRFNKDF